MSWLSWNVSLMSWLIEDEFDKLGKLYCKFDELDKLYCKLSCTVSSMSWLS